MNFSALLSTFFTKKLHPTTRNTMRINHTRRSRLKFGTSTQEAGGQLNASNEKPWCVVQYDDRNISDNINQLMNRNKHYCNKYGYKYIFLSSGYEDIPPYWRKVQIVKDLINSDKYKGILWLDTDATIFNMDITLDNFNDPKKSFYSSTNSTGNQIFNAGVWIVYNNNKGKNILAKWMLKYNPAKWKKNNNKWSTASNWAGKNYEQGSFAYNIKPKFNSNIKTEPELTFQATNFRKPGVFILHFYNRYRSEIPEFLKYHTLPMILDK